MKKHIYAFILLILFLTLSACQFMPAEQAVPIETVFAATYAAIQAETAAAIPPTETLTPTPIKLRATITPYPSATHVVLGPTTTPSAIPEVTATNVTGGSGNVLYACNILSTSPESGYKVKAKEKFRWALLIENIGTTTWTPKTIRVRYIRGAKFHLNDSGFLEDPVRAGKSGVFIVNMEAPKEPGKYTTTWALRKGIHEFCFVKFVIHVKK